MNRLKAPSHRSLVRPYLKNKNLRKKIEAGVQRLKVVSRIVELREQSGITQAELARRIGVSQPFIAKIENDQAANLSLETLVKIVTALNGELDIQIHPLKKAA
jgi:DNA-binding XRE family transcriptional regulator